MRCKDILHPSRLNFSIYHIVSLGQFGGMGWGVGGYCELLGVAPTVGHVVNGVMWSFCRCDPPMLGELASMRVSVLLCSADFKIYRLLPLTYAYHTFIVGYQILYFKEYENYFSWKYLTEI